MRPVRELGLKTAFGDSLQIGCALGGTLPGSLTPAEADLVTRHFNVLTPENCIAYICGNPDMILAAEATLLERGYPEDQVHKELYWPKGKEPRGVAGADLAAAIDAAEANADQ